MHSEHELTGIDEILRAVRQRLEAGSARVERNALKAAGEAVAGSMQQKVAVSNLSYARHTRDNITVSGIRRKDGLKYVLIGPNKKVSWRAHFIEFGTSNQSAQPFIEPAFREKKDEALQILAEELRKGLRIR
ncbi:HK97 gp10 family phage protein [Brevibacillus nitrificans]|uniref:HK97 gp10 family phage protein n=1 Tax=Brevibacillus nitrificans TaxID=651560 RepID=A0A3M8DRP5_9BACL|nr:HK97-gp10 family putative phage morphogenesis protein [Brevibacillus nitrificans]RNB90159.1 HK97 gp10 family phage protein [Brevibacillus nitrificans]